MAFAALALAAVASTWPLALRAGESIPAGGGAPTVALFGLFSMEWTARALEEGLPYWDAPFFHPHRGTFAWSETQPFTAGLVWVLSRAVGLVPAYNLVVWLYLASFGLSGYGLARQLTSDRVAALWSALWLTGGAFSIEQLGVVHLLAGAFPVACLAAVLASAERARPAFAWGGGAALLLTFLTCAQFGLFLVLLLPLVLLALYGRERRGWARAARAAALLAAGVLLALPWLLRQRSHLESMGFERELVNVRGVYLPADLVTPASGHWLAGRILGISDAPDAYPWDLGLVPLLIAGAAAAAGAFRRRHLEGSARKRAGALVLLSAAALLLGFGPRLAIGESIVPYAWLHGAVPGLAGVRTPSRAGVFAIVGIAALAAAGLAFWRRRSASRGARRALTGAAFVLLAGEMWAAPIALVDPGAGVDDHRAVLRRLDGEAPVVDLPMAASDGEADLEREVRAMGRALRHRQPVVNGYSGYFPEPYRQLRWAMEEDPAGRGRRYLLTLGVRWALIHDHELPPDGRRALVAGLRGEPVFADGSDTVLRLPLAAGVRPLRAPRATPRFSTRPRTGDILTLPFASGADRARLVEPGSGGRLRVLWTDEAGLPHNAVARLGGSVLVDAGKTWLYVLLQRFSERGGRAVLVSEERVARGRGR